MNQTLAIVASGLVCGTVTAFATRAPLAERSNDAPIVREERVVERPIAPPPGWDARFLSELAAVKAEVAALRDANAPQEVNAKETEREAERAQLYEKELTSHAARIEDHAREPDDRGWAAPLEGALTDSLAKAHELAPGGYEVQRASCRSKTCVATLRFTGPELALRYLHSSSPVVSVPAGCNGMLATPTPPTHAGDYDLDLVYTCR